MTRSFINQAIRDNWYLIILFLVIVASLPLFAFRSAPSSSEALTPTDALQMDQVSDPGRGDFPPATVRISEQTRAREIIAEHQQRFDADPRSVEAPALLSAMGNLYRQKLSDYEQAAGCFERLLSEYPDDSNVRDAYLQLLICYERLGDQENRRRVLRQLMDKYPPESQEHQFAVHELGIVE